MKFLAAALFIVVLVLAQWAWFQAPCGVWKFANASEAPARCVMQR